MKVSVVRRGDRIALLSVDGVSVWVEVANWERDPARSEKSLLAFDAVVARLAGRS